MDIVVQRPVYMTHVTTNAANNEGSGCAICTRCIATNKLAEPVSPFPSPPARQKHEKPKCPKKQQLSLHHSSFFLLLVLYCYGMCYLLPCSLESRMLILRTSVSVYFLRRFAYHSHSSNGSHSCQLVFRRSRFLF